MFRNYLVTALRNIARHKLYSIINIAGLAVGLACVIFIALFIRDELSYDKWIPDTQNLYRVEKIAHIPGRDPLNLAIAPFILPATMRDAIPEVTAMTRVYYYTMTLFAGDRPFRQHIAFVDPNIFAIIKLPLVQGDPALIFKDPESVVISESAARKYFGTTDAVGKVIKTTANCEESDTACLARLVPLKVTGIMRDIPHNSQLDGDVFIPNTSITNRMAQPDRQSWFGNCCYSYVVLALGTQPQTVVAKMGPVLDRIVPDDPDNPRKASQRYTVHLTPFTDVHLTAGRWSSSETPPGSWTTLYGVGIVGGLILLVACFNFMNLSTARALSRAREIALRKTHGARRSQLVVQFLGEAVLMALLSLVLALALVEILQPAFGRLLLHPVGLNYASDGPLLLVIVGITIVAGLVSGAYPALVLSGFRPVMTLRANTAGQAGSGRLRTALVVLQFAVSIGLGVAAIVVFAQINFARNIDLGFRKDNLLVVSGEGLLSLGGHESFVQRLRSNPGIQDVAVTGAVPFGTYVIGLVAARLPGHSQMIGLNMLTIGTNAAQLMGMRLIAGRLLSGNRAQDQFNWNGGAEKDANEDRNVLIDDVAAAALGFTPQQVVGKSIILGKSHVHVVGVVANVKFGNAREPAMATMYVYDPHLTEPVSVLIRLRPDAMPQTLSSIKRAWHDFAPTKVMNSWFMSDVLGRQYRNDERQGDLFSVFVVIAIFIACLGLFGLAALAAGRRTREIGVRKVFGARTGDVLWLLLWQFTIPVALANLIAWPVAWYYLHGWLEGFAYRITLSPIYFIAAGLVALTIAWATIFVHAWRVARANPVHALRYE